MAISFEKIFKRYIFVVVVSTLCGCLTATVQANTGSNQNSDKSESFREVTDMVGRRVKLTRRVNRIVTTFKPATLLTIAAGMGNKLVGVDSHSLDTKLVQLSIKHIDKLTPVGTRTAGINLETLISLNPDLVVLYSQKDGIQFADRLQAQGIPAIVILPESFGQIRQAIRLLAEAGGESSNGKTTYAQRSIAQMDKVLQKVKQRVVGIAAAEIREVYYVSPGSIFSTLSGDMLQFDMITRAGGSCAAGEFKGHFRTISPEQLFIWNPDVILISNQHKSSLTRLTESSRFADIRAIKNNMILNFPSAIDPWDYPAPSSALGVLWIAKNLYPKRMVDINLHDETTNFYQQVYGIDNILVNSKSTLE